MLTFAIGDIHGCLDKLTALLGRCRHYAQGRPSRFVFVGDYIDRGPDSRGVVEALITLQAEQPGTVCLRGNHEAIMLDALSTGDLLLWLVNGAGETLASYGIEHPNALPRRHVDWIANLPLWFDDGRRFFVHAGIDPNVPLDRQSERDLLWIREPFLVSARDYGRLIVHGHTPLRSGMPELRPNRLNIDTAAVYGGPLSAAVFDEETVPPFAFLSVP
jgi:serine/threonine protein phosphatase 1